MTRKLRLCPKCENYKFFTTFYNHEECSCGIAQGEAPTLLEISNCKRCKLVCTRCDNCGKTLEHRADKDPFAR